MTTITNLKKIQENFEKNVYGVENFPELLSLGNNGVYVHPSASYLHLAHYLEHPPFKEAMLTTHKLKTSDWNACVIKAPQSYFESRDMFDELVISEKYREFDSRVRKKGASLNERCF